VFADRRTDGAFLSLYPSCLANERKNDKVRRKDERPKFCFTESLLFPLFLFSKTQPLDSISSNAVCLLSQFIGPLLIGVLLFKLYCATDDRVC